MPPLTEDQKRMATLEAENAKLKARVKELEHRIHEASEVYAGLEGVKPQTAADRYRQMMLQKMYDALWRMK
jgi:cell division septum initiation protein DivIVA